MALTCGGMMQAGVSFGANLVLVRFLMPEDFGSFAVALASASLVISVLSLRLNVLIIRSSESHLDERRRSLYATALLVEVLVATLVAVLWLAAIGHTGLMELLLVASVGVGHWVATSKGFFERSMPFRTIALVETGGALVGHCAAIGLALAGFGAVSLYLREMVAVLVTFAGLVLVGGLTFVRPRWISGPEWRALLTEARGIWFDSVLEGVFGRMVILVVAGLSGLRGTGFFSQAQRLAGTPHQVAAPVFTRLAAAWFGQTRDAAMRARGRRQLLVLAFVLLAFGAALAVGFGETAIVVIFGETWRPVAPLLALMAGSIIFSTLYEINRAYALSVGATRAALSARLAQYAVFLLVVALGVGWGVEAAALALSGAFAAAFVVLEVGIRYHERNGVASCAA